MSRECQILRVFTRDGAGGNHLGVVTEGCGIDDAIMQGIAADLGFSETIFLIRGSDGPSVRIFTPAIELPFAGHPLVGITWVLVGLEGEAIDTIRCGAGDVRVGMEGDAAWIEAPIDPANSHRDDRTSLAARAGLPVPARSWTVSIPMDYVILEYADAATVAAATPAADALAEVIGTLIFARDADRVRARFFAPSGGIYEDPATGSAAVALATALLAEGESQGSVTVHQGEEMGHPSQIDLSWRHDAARIGGGCVRDEIRSIPV
jgi:trans-2,3-dihydro-3-hydroxyanthranilate isomerase